MPTLRIKAYSRPTGDLADFRLITTNEEHHFASHKVENAPGLQPLFDIAAGILPFFEQVSRAAGKSLEIEFELQDQDGEHLMQIVQSNEIWELLYLGSHSRK